MWQKFKEWITKFFTLNDEQVDFIGGGEALPAPLDPEEEKALITRYMQGDSAAKSLLIEHNLRLVVYIAKKFENTNVDIEDLISVGTIGLIKAVNSFDDAKQIKLATYASRCIENEILMHLRKVIKT
ncbi:MAG: sigma-70 family RNA polymerase sigma factor, partial [Clostridia bacterium]|nr:sigma-70 family RNA polymerase sigma factor [Clostridia bacterium]